MDDNVTDDINKEAFDFLVELRGGIPDNCDFCGKEFTEENYATPEECGDWACISCVKRWDEMGEN